MNEWDAIKVKRIKRLKQISFPLNHSVIQWERERESERKTLRQGRITGAEAEEATNQRQISNEWWPIYRLASTIYKNTTRSRGKKREIPWGRAGGSTGAEADLRFAMRGERRRRRRASCGVVATWPWVCWGLVFICLLGIFFFKIKTSVSLCSLCFSLCALCLVCCWVWFAL